MVGSMLFVHAVVELVAFQYGIWDWIACAWHYLDTTEHPLALSAVSGQPSVSSSACSVGGAGVSK